MLPKTSGYMQKQVERGQAPKSIDHIDTASPPRDRFDHVHLNDERHGKHALYNNGEWKHGGRPLTNQENEWVIK